MRELETNRPEYFVSVGAWDSRGEGWVCRWRRLSWRGLRKFMNHGYEKAVVADLGSASQYVWDDATRTYTPHPSQAVYFLRRWLDGEAR